jgi:hypothetical protein
MRQTGIYYKIPTPYDLNDLRPKSFKFGVFEALTVFDFFFKSRNGLQT